ncbi:Uncharacterised protein [Mycobacterium tuberculosis]|nr:Uncharacterised protein [Mycobacterium tuberculosis]
MAAAIGTVFRLERRFEGLGGSAQLVKHGLEYVVVEQAQPAIPDLQGDVTIAQVIGGAGQFKRAVAGDVQQLFRTGTDAYDTSVFRL